MALTRRSKLLDRTTNRLDAKAFVIATEGAETERAYFEAFNPPPVHRMPFEPSPIQVKVLPPLAHRSAPQHVLAQVHKFVKKQRLDPRDEIWLGVDVDNWQPRTLAKVCAAATRSRFGVVVSNPCIEVWHCYHFSSCHDADIHQEAHTKEAGQNLKRLWRRHLPPSATRIERTLLRPLARTACERARLADKGDIAPDHPWPAAPGTRLYVLTVKLLDALAE